MMANENCGNCRMKIYDISCGGCVDACKCGKCYSPPTNADRIRAMCDEELAWVLMEFRFDALAKANGSEPALPNTQKKICKWLKQPAEGEQ